MGAAPLLVDAAFEIEIVGAIVLVAPDLFVIDIGGDGVGVCVVDDVEVEPFVENVGGEELVVVVFEGAVADVEHEGC